MNYFENYRIINSLLKEDIIERFGNPEVKRSCFKSSTNSIRQVITMYEVTISVNGVLQTQQISANNYSELFMIVTNMYSGNNVQIINYRRV